MLREPQYPHLKLRNLIKTARTTTSTQTKASKFGSRWNFILAVDVLLLEMNKIIQRTNWSRSLRDRSVMVETGDCKNPSECRSDAPSLWQEKPNRLWPEIALCDEACDEPPKLNRKRAWKHTTLRPCSPFSAWFRDYSTNYGEICSASATSG